MRRLQSRGYNLNIRSRSKFHWFLFFHPMLRRITVFSFFLYMYINLLFYTCQQSFSPKTVNKLLLSHGDSVSKLFYIHISLFHLERTFKTDWIAMPLQGNQYFLGIALLRNTNKDFEARYFKKLVNFRLWADCAVRILSFGFVKFWTSP